VLPLVRWHQQGAYNHKIIIIVGDVKKPTVVPAADECGIHRTYLSSVERSERNVSIDNIARIAKGLRVEPWQLLKDD